MNGWTLEHDRKTGKVTLKLSSQLDAHSADNVTITERSSIVLVFTRGDPAGERLTRAVTRLQNDLEERALRTLEKARASRGSGAIAISGQTPTPRPG